MSERRPIDTVEEDEVRVTSSAKTETELINKLLFYNPGPRFVDIVRYDSPFILQETGKSPQVVQALMQVTAEAKSFFEVPQSVKIINEESGTEEIAAIKSIYTRVMSQLRERGVVLVEKNRNKTRREDPNVAASKEEARELGADLYDRFMREKAQEWYNAVESAVVNQQVPQRATGLYAQALKHLHLADPANRVEVIEHERKSAGSQKETNAEVVALKEQLAELKGMIAGMVAAGKGAAA